MPSILKLNLQKKTAQIGKHSYRYYNKRMPI